MNPTLPDRIACAYKFADRYVVHSHARTTAGFYVACEPYLLLRIDCFDEELGQAVQTALCGFKVSVTTPTNWKEFRQQWVASLGAKSERQLQRASLYCGISDYGDHLEFEPSHNGGTSGDTRGFAPLGDRMLRLPGDTPSEQLGEAMRRAFALCSTIYEPT
jgi:hypothetical protein